MDIIKVTSAQEQNDVIKTLQGLHEGHKERGYKFVYTHKSEMIISTIAKDGPNHGDLGKDYKEEEIIAAGWVKSILDNNSQLAEVNLINRSGIYCKSFESLQEVESFIFKILGALKINLTNDQNKKCP